ncbi:MAG: hypothetical protein JWM35_1969 [Verrucomicrobia bacterium]|nr:hypothetical protein [Verrucomicrobiota bacterium]
MLIDGKDHQYHDGSEGTNASWAVAAVIGYATGPGWMAVTSDATDAYRLVNDKVTRVHRTLVYLKPDVVVFLDRVALKDAAASVQVRFQANNEDAAAELSSTDDGFRINRPHATLVGRVARTAGRTVHIDKLPLEEQDGNYPFAEVVSSAASEHELLTVCSARPAGESHGDLKITAEGGQWRVQGKHASQDINVTIAASGDAAPKIEIG